MLNDADIPEDIKPLMINPLGNYAVQISWEDGFNQVMAFELLESLRGLGFARKLPVGAISADLKGGIQAVADFAE